MAYFIISFFLLLGTSIFGMYMPQTERDFQMSKGNIRTEADYQASKGNYRTEGDRRAGEAYLMGKRDRQNNIPPDTSTSIEKKPSLDSNAFSSPQSNVEFDEDVVISTTDFFDIELTVKVSDAPKPKMSGVKIASGVSRARYSDNERCNECNLKLENVAEAYHHLINDHGAHILELFQKGSDWQVKYRTPQSRL